MSTSDSGGCPLHHRELTRALTLRSAGIDTIVATESIYPSFGCSDASPIEDQPAKGVTDFLCLSLAAQYMQLPSDQAARSSSIFLTYIQISAAIFLFGFITQGFRRRSDLPGSPTKIEVFFVPRGR